MVNNRLSVLSAVFVLAAGAAELPVIPGDSTRGAKLFQTQQCVHCHAVNGAGGKVGIDLGRSVSRKYTPALLASTMWNHGPVMWGAMESAGIETPKLSEEDAADLFAFFYSVTPPAASRRSLRGNAVSVTESKTPRPRARRRWSIGSRSTTPWCWCGRCGITATGCTMRSRGGTSSGRR